MLEVEVAGVLDDGLVIDLDRPDGGRVGGGGGALGVVRDGGDPLECRRGLERRVGVVQRGFVPAAELLGAVLGDRSKVDDKVLFFISCQIRVTVGVLAPIMQDESYKQNKRVITEK